jgi:hypothetical protein
MASFDTIYQLQFRVSGKTVWQNYGPLTEATSELVTGLNPDTSYDFQVVASNPAGAVISPTVTIETLTPQSTTQITGATASGSGALLANVNLPAQAKAALIGRGAVSPVPMATIHITAHLAGAGSIVASATQSVWGVAVKGIGAVSALAISEIAAKSAVAGAALVAATGVVNHSALSFVSIAGAAGVTIGGQRITFGAVPINGISTIGVVSGGASKATATLQGSAVVKSDTTSANAQVWSSVHKFANMTLSNNASTASEQTTADDSSVYAQTTATTGRYYWEILVSCADPTLISVGIGNINASIASQKFVGVDTNSMGWVIGQGVVAVNSVAVSPTWPTVGTNTLIAFALDLTSTPKALYGRVGNGPWYGGSPTVVNPVTFTGGDAIPASVLSAAVAPGCSLSAIGDFVNGYFSAISWTYEPPAGYSSWDTANNPQAPNNLQATNVTGTTLTLIWTSS